MATQTKTWLQTTTKCDAVGCPNEYKNLVKVQKMRRTTTLELNPVNDLSFRLQHTMLHKVCTPNGKLGDRDIRRIKSLRLRFNRMPYG